MPCHVTFDFLSDHNGEYWYKCDTCGARDWFGRSASPRSDNPLEGCQAKDLQDMTREQLMGQVMRYRRRLDRIEDWLETFPGKKP
jgi:hypothetical protein